MSSTNLINLNQLSLLIRKESNELLCAWRERVRTLPISEGLDAFTLDDHIPDLIEELSEELSGDHTDKTLVEELKESPVKHGLNRLKNRFDVEEVVAEYNALRYVIFHFVKKHKFLLDEPETHIINHVIDRSIALAVKTYTDRKALEIKNQRAEHLSFVAHDLRTPLAAMGMAAALLKKSLAKENKDAAAAKYLEELQRNILRLNTLIVKVVQEEAEEGSQRKLLLGEVELRTLVDELIRDIRPLAEASNTALVNAVPEQLTAFADNNLLNLILQNLISNAITYTEKGSVTIGAKDAKELCAVECWVTDTGVGISPEQIGKVFEKLETSSKKGGLGLGLAIVKKFVEIHGGKVTVESILGAGSTFRFTLPYDPRAKK